MMKTHAVEPVVDPSRFCRRQIVRYRSPVDPAIWAAIVGGVITGIPVVGAVLLSNKANRKAVEASNKANREMAEVAARDTKRQADRQELLARMQDLKADLRSPDEDVALDALDEMRALALTLTEEADRRLVWNALMSRIARKVQLYPEHGPQVQIARPRIPPELEG